MSDSVDEQLSALLDGELPGAEAELLFARLDRDPERRQRLARYAMIGESLRTGPAPAGTLDIAERVRAALEVEAIPAPRPARMVSRRGWQVAALAAGAAAIAVLVLDPAAVPPPAAPVAQAPSGSDLLEESLSPVTAPATRRLGPDAAARLTGYLAAHGQYANALSRNSLDSHLVAAGAERAVWRQRDDGGYDR